MAFQVQHAGSYLLTINCYYAICFQDPGSGHGQGGHGIYDISRVFEVGAGLVQNETKQLGIRRH